MTFSRNAPEEIARVPLTGVCRITTQTSKKSIYQITLPKAGWFIPFVVKRVGVR